MPYVPELQQFFDDSGDPLVGGKLYFYESGETHTGGTLKATHSDEARTSANSNPVVLDANGRLPNAVYMDKTAAYKVALDDSADVNLWELDAVYGTATLNDETTRRRAIANSPMDHGAAGDGSTDDATALQAALDRSGVAVVDLEGKTYRCDSILTMSNGQTLRNGSIDFSNAAIAAGVRCLGSAESTPRAVTSAATQSQTITPDSVSGLSVGDLIRLRSSDTVATGHKYAELFRVEQVSGSNVLVDGSIEGTYTTAPLVEEITPVRDVTLERLTLTAPSSGYVAEFILCQRITIRQCQFKGTSNSEALRLLSVYDAIIDSCRFYQKTTTEAAGLIIGDASRDVTVSKCRFERQFRSFEIGADYEDADGLTRDTTVRDCHFQWFGKNTIEAGALSTRIIGNTFLSDIAPSSTAHALNVAGGNADIVNNQFRNYSDNAININLVADADWVNIHNNTFYATTGATHAIEIEDTAQTLTSFFVSGNRYKSTVTGASFIVPNGTTITTFMVTDNVCHWDSNGSHYVVNFNSADDIVHAVVDGNMAYDGGVVFGSPASGGTEVSISVNGNTTNRQLVNSIGNGDNAGWSQKAIVGNMCTGDTGAAIYVRNRTNGAADTDSCLIALNTVKQPAASSPGLHVEGGLNVAVVGNVLSTASTTGSDRGIHIDNVHASVPMENVLISSNVVWAERSPILVDASGGDEIDNVVIANNILRQSVASGSGGVIAAAEGGGKVVRMAIVGNISVRADDNDDNILLTAAEEVTIVGNVTWNGTYAVDVSAAAVTNDVVAGNCLQGHGTGAINGTPDVSADNDTA